MNASEASQVLSYKSPDVKAPRGQNWLGIVAFVSSLLFSPFLRLAVGPRPFWTGHPYHWIREIVESVPVLALPLPGVVLGAYALAAAATFNQRRGLAIAATVIGVGWCILLGVVFVWVVRSFPVPS